MLAGALHVDEVRRNVRHLPPRGGSASLIYLLVPPIDSEEAYVDIPDDEAMSWPMSDGYMLPVSRAAAVESLSLGTGDVGESRRRAGGTASADHHRKEEVQHHRDDNDRTRTYFKLKQNSAEWLYHLGRA